MSDSTYYESNKVDLLIDFDDMTTNETINTSFPNESNTISNIIDVNFEHQVFNLFKTKQISN